MSTTNGIPPEPSSPRPDNVEERPVNASALSSGNHKILDQFNALVISEKKYDTEIGKFIAALKDKYDLTTPDIKNLSRDQLNEYMDVFLKNFHNQSDIEDAWDEMLVSEKQPFVEKLHKTIMSSYAKNTASATAHPPTNMDTKHSKEAQGVTVTSTSSMPGATATPSTSSPKGISTSPGTDKKSSISATNADVKSKAADVTTAYGVGAKNGTGVPPAAASTATSASVSTTSTIKTPLHSTPGTATPPSGQQPPQQQSSLQFQGEAPQQSAQPAQSTQPKQPAPLQHQYSTLRDLASAKRLVDIPANNPIVAEGDPGPRTEQQLKEANAKFTKAITDKYGSLNVHATYNNNDGSVKVTIPNKRNPENPQQHDELERRVENGKPKVKLTNPPDDVSINILLEQNEDILPLKMSKLCPNNLDKTSHYTNLNTILRLMEASTISGRVIEFDPADMAAFDALKNSKDPAEQALLHRFDYLYALRQEQGPQLEAFKQHVKAEENAGRRWEYGQSTITKELLAQKPELPKPEAESPSPGHN